MPEMRKGSGAFTALEMLIAIAIGIVIALTTFSLFRAVATTFNAVSRMSQENQAMRTGLLAVCEQNVDYWVDVDDPLGDPGDPRPDYLKNVIRNAWNANVWNQTDPTKPIDGNAGQGLRGFDVTRSSVGENWCTGSKQGLPFTPFEWLRDLYEFNDPNLRIFTPSAAAAAGTEDETGWDRNLHWAAADERTWFQGDAAVIYPQTPASTPNAGTSQPSRRLQFGRYAIISNPYRSANLQGDPGNGYTDSAFGTVSPLRSWRERMLLSLVNGLGYYGTAEYLPINTIYATHGAEFLNAAGTATLRSDNRSVMPLPATSAEAPTPCWSFTGTVSGGSGTTYYGFPGWIGGANELFWGAQILNFGVNPASVYARDPLYASTANYSYLGSTAKNQSQVRTTGMIAVHRDNDARINHSGPIYHGPLGNYEGMDYAMVNMSTAKRPLLLQRPANWPEVIVGTSRVLWGGQFMNTCVVRWSDPVTGKFKSFTFNAIGTTLRGARQQRRLPSAYTDVGGWARWIEPWPLRQQRKILAPADPSAQVPNDRCLDDYADPGNLDPEFLP